MYVYYYNNFKINNHIKYDKNKILLKSKVVYKSPLLCTTKFSYIFGNFGAVTTGLASSNSLRPSFL